MIEQSDGKSKALCTYTLLVAQWSFEVSDFHPVCTVHNLSTFMPQTIISKVCLFGITGLLV